MTQLAVHNGVLISAAILSGLFAVGYGRVFRSAEHLYWDLVRTSPAFGFLLTPALFLAAWGLVHRYSPAAGGSGIPQVLAANSFEDDKFENSPLNAFLSLRMMIVKTLSSLLCASGGGAIGNEGPTIQISAGIFHLLGRNLKKRIPDLRSHLWIVSGASAGLAAAFNTPLGGIIYAIEELGAAHFERVRKILLISIIVAGLVALALNGNDLYLGASNSNHINISGWPMAALIGCLGGFFGGLFSILLFAIFKMRRKIKNTRTLAILSLGAGLVMAFFLLLDPKNSGSGIEMMNDVILHNGTITWNLFFSRFLATAVSFSSGSAAGIFAPSLTMGGCLGGSVASMLGIHDQGLLILLGMVAFMTGFTKTPFTAAILVMEMSDQHAAIFQMLLAALLASLVSGFVTKHSFYENAKDLLIGDLDTERLQKVP